MGALQQDDFKLNVGDERFSELYDNPHFNIDPSAPEFKKTKAMESLIGEKVKRRKLQKNKQQSASTHQTETVVMKCTDGKTRTEDKTEMTTMASKKGTDQSLASLVKSVKAK